MEKTHRNPRPAFGIPLVELIFSQEDTLPVPWFLQQLCDFLFLQCLATRDLFHRKVDPDLPELNKVIKQINSGVDISLNTPEMAHVAATVIEMLFTYLPDPLIPHELLDPILEVTHIAMQSPPTNTSFARNLTQQSASSLDRSSSGIMGPGFLKRITKNYRESQEFQLEKGKGTLKGNVMATVDESGTDTGSRRHSKKKNRKSLKIWKKHHHHDSAAEQELALDEGYEAKREHPPIPPMIRKSERGRGEGPSSGQGGTHRTVRDHVHQPSAHHRDSPVPEHSLIKEYAYVQKDVSFCKAAEELVLALPIANRNVLHFLCLLLHAITCNKHTSGCSSEALAEKFASLGLGEHRYTDALIAMSNAFFLYLTNPNRFFPTLKNRGKSPSLGIQTPRGISEGVRICGYENEGNFTCITATPDRKQIWVGTQTGVILVYDAETNMIKSNHRIAQSDTPVEDLESDGSKIWAATSKKISILETTYNRRTNQMEEGACKLYLIRREYMLGLTTQREPEKPPSINVWNVRKLEKVKSVELSPDLRSLLPQIVFVPQTSQICLAVRDVNEVEKVILFSTEKWIFHDFITHQGKYGEAFVAIAPVFTRLWVASSSQTIYICDPVTGKGIDKFSVGESITRFISANSKKSTYFGVSFSPSGMRCIGNEVWMWSSTYPRIVIIDPFNYTVIDMFYHHLKAPSEVLPLYSEVNKRWEARVACIAKVIATYSVLNCNHQPYEDVGHVIQSSSSEPATITKQLISPEKDSPVYWGKYQQQDVAVQVVPTDMTLSVDVLPFIEKTVELLRAVNHPNVLQFFGTQTQHVNLCIMREHTDAMSLENAIQEEEEFDALLVLRQISETMQFLHSALQKFYHGCLKLTTVYLDHLQEVKIGWNGSHLRKRKRKEKMSWIAPEVLIRFSQDEGHLSSTEEIVSEKSKIRYGTLSRQAAGVLTIPDGKAEKKEKEEEKEQEILEFLASNGESADVFSFGVLMMLLLSRTTSIPIIATHSRLLNFFKEHSNIDEGLSQILSQMSAPTRRLCLRCLALNPKDRPQFRQISKQLEYAFVTAEIPHDEKAALFWAGAFKSAKKTLWSKFMVAFASATHSDVSVYQDTSTPNSPGKFLFTFVVEESEDPSLHISTFSELLRFFGPFGPRFLDNISEVLNTGWFFGRQTDTESNSYLDKCPDSFLVRYASELGGFTVVALYKGKYSKVRISRNDKDEFVAPAAGSWATPSLIEAVTKVVTEKLGITEICPGSPYSIPRQSILPEEGEEENEEGERELGIILNDEEGERKELRNWRSRIRNPASMIRRRTTSRFIDVDDEEEDEKERRKTRTPRFFGRKPSTQVHVEKEKEPITENETDPSLRIERREETETFNGVLGSEIGSERPIFEADSGSGSDGEIDWERLGIQQDPVGLFGRNESIEQGLFDDDKEEEGGLFGGSDDEFGGNSPRALLVDDYDGSGYSNPSLRHLSRRISDLTEDDEPPI